MTHRLSLDPPLASADTWAGRQARAKAHVAIMDKAKAREAQIESSANESAAWLSTSREGDDVTPLAEHVVLECLRALKVIQAAPYAKELTDMISRNYLETPEPMVRLRRIDALLKIDAEGTP